jgi:hypothetical protein
LATSFDPEAFYWFLHPLLEELRDPTASASISTVVANSSPMNSPRSDLPPTDAPKPASPSISAVIESLVVALCVLAMGCVNGPARYETLGFRKSATAEFFRRAPLAAKPLAGLAGAPIDAAACVADTAADLVLMYPITVTHGGPDASGCPHDPGATNAILCGIGSLVWSPATLLALQIWPEEAYSEIFGPSSGFFAGGR